MGFWNTRTIFRLNPDTGATETIVSFAGVTSGRPYGMAIDNQQRIWLSMRDGNPSSLAMVDLNKFPLQPKAWATPGHNTYGIAIDSNGRPWLAGAEHRRISRFDPDTEKWKTIFLTQYPFTRGVAASTDGLVYVAHHSWGGNCGQSHYISVLDADTGNLNQVVDYATTTNHLGPVGLAIDFSDNLWAINQCASSATKIDRLTMETVGTYATGKKPYTYSDMTGFALKTVVAPEGTYVHAFEGWEGANTQWHQLSVTTLTPQGSSYDIRIRTGDTPAAVQAAPWGPSLGPFPPKNMPIDLNDQGNVTGKHLECIFTADDDGSIPGRRQPAAVCPRCSNGSGVRSARLRRCGMRSVPARNPESVQHIRSQRRPTLSLRLGTANGHIHHPGSQCVGGRCYRRTGRGRREL